MFGSLFGGKKSPLRPMEPGDVEQVLYLIEQHDEDDAAEAAESFAESLDGMFVLTSGRWIVGVTGAHVDPEVPDVYWLSWTYLAPMSQGQGHGQQMVDHLGEMLLAEGCRKVFIATSDYQEEGEDLYANARAFYENSMGAQLEATLKDYYAPGESQLIYGAVLGEGRGAPDEPEAFGPLRFIGIAKAPEADDGRVALWEVLEAGAAAPEGDLEPLIAQARREGARFLAATAPADLAGPAAARLTAAGFARAGEMRDYDAPGVNREIWQLLL